MNSEHDQAGDVAGDQLRQALDLVQRIDQDESWILKRQSDEIKATQDAISGFNKSFNERQKLRCERATLHALLSIAASLVRLEKKPQ